MATDKKKLAGQYTHWARPRWIRMYSYNYEFGESYYRPQVQYLSTSRVASDSTSYAEARQSYLQRRRTVSPPRAQSFIERWASEPFYGYGFRSSASTRRARSEVRSSDYSARSSLEQSSLSSSSVQRSIRERRARSVEAATSYPSDIYNATAASDDCLMRSSALDSTSRYSRARSVSRAREQSYSAELDAQQSALESSSRYSRARSVSRAREQSLQQFSSAIDAQQAAYNSRYAREGSVLNSLRGSTPDVDAYNYEYPKHHLVCTERCPLFNDPLHHRRFVIGNKFADAAALGGFDVLYDPTVYNRTRTLLKRCSEERDVDLSSSSYQRASSSSRDTQSQSRRVYAYNTIY